MSIFKRREKRSGQIGFLCSGDAWQTLCASEYTSLDKNPEVLTCCRKIADVISSMTIYLMANTEKGDIRIINEMSRKMDIQPNAYMTRKTLIDAFVMNLILYGNGNAVIIPHTKDGYLGDLEVARSSRVSFRPDGYGYKILIDGVANDPSQLIHCVLNPDPEYPWRGRGFSFALKDVANNLKQAAATERGFMQSKWKPSVIVKVDGLIEEFSDPKGRKKLLDDYVSTTEAGEPWIIPSEQFAIEQVRPLSLADLAIADCVQLDKKTVASVLGVPPFVLGVGEYNANEWNAFINNTVRPIAREIEQEFTRKLLISPKWYFRFNIGSVYSYDLTTLSNVYGSLRKAGVVTGNEVRDKVGMEPIEGLDKLVVLENYINLDDIGKQSKLFNGGQENG